MIRVNAASYAAPPEVPQAWVAVIESSSKSNISGFPSGTGTSKEWYDYPNLKQRLDYVDNSGNNATKLYRYDELFPPEPPVRNFATPRGYKIQGNMCCWEYLQSQGNPELMDEISIPKHAHDAGAVTIDGKQAELWTAKQGIPKALDVHLSYYVDSSANLIQFNQHVVVGSYPNSEYADVNATYNTFVPGPIDASIFAYNNATCKQCGTDGCPVYFCNS